MRRGVNLQQNCQFSCKCAPPVKSYTRFRKDVMFWKRSNAAKHSERHNTLSQQFPGQTTNINNATAASHEITRKMTEICRSVSLRVSNGQPCAQPSCCLDTWWADTGWPSMSSCSPSQALSLSYVKLMDIWADLPQANIQKAILSARKRLKSCITAEGGHFEHLSL